MSGEKRRLVKYIVIFVLLSFVILSLTAIIHSSTVYVTEYKIQDVSENSVVVEANLSKATPVILTTIKTEGIAKSNVLTSQYVSDTITYEIYINQENQDRRQFITDESVYLSSYKIYSGLGVEEYSWVFNSDYKSSTYLSESLSDDYSDLSSKYEELVLYEDDITVTEYNKSNRLTIVSDLDESQNSKISNMSNNISQKFNTKSQNVLIYVVPDVDLKWSGYIENRYSGQKIIWFENYREDFKLDKIVYHETVHAHQNFRTSEDMEWFTEGSATYISSLENSKTEKYIGLENMINLGWYGGSDGDIKNIELKDPDTWNEDVEYHRSEHVTYLIDASLRHHTDGDVTIYDIMNWMNKEEHITYDEFRSKIVRHTDEEFGKRLDSYMGSRNNTIDVKKEKSEITQSGEINLRISESETREYGLFT